MSAFSALQLQKMSFFTCCQGIPLIFSWWFITLTLSLFFSSASVIPTKVVQFRIPCNDCSPETFQMPALLCTRLQPLSSSIQLNVSFWYPWPQWVFEQLYCCIIPVAIRTPTTRGEVLSIWPVSNPPLKYLRLLLRTITKPCVSFPKKTNSCI